MTDALNGRCLCGKVMFTATPKSMQMGVCHCSMCRKWTGGTFMAVDCSGGVRFEEGAPVKAYDSSAWGERLFCSNCGSTLVWQTKDKSHQSVAAQAFDDPAAFAFAMEIFIDQKPDNYEFANETKKMTEAEIMAMFAPKE